MRTYIGLAVLAAAIGIGAPASAQNAMQVCGAKYQAAKTAKTLPAGQTWNQFLAQCRATMTPAATGPSKPAANRPATAGQTAARTRQRACGEQWRAAKAAGKVPTGQKWPQYYSQCNARMK